MSTNEKKPVKSFSQMNSDEQAISNPAKYKSQTESEKNSSAYAKDVKNNGSDVANIQRRNKQIASQLDSGNLDKKSRMSLQNEYDTNLKKIAPKNRMTSDGYMTR